MAKRQIDNKQWNRMRRLTAKRSRIILLILLIFGFGIGIFGLFKQTIIYGEQNQRKAERKQLSDTLNYAKRGTIYDCNGNILAQSAGAWKIYLDPAAIDEEEDSRKIADYFSKNFNCDYDEVLKASKKKKTRYVVIAEKIDINGKQKIEEFIKENRYARMIGFEDDVERYYPYDNTASTVLGFTGAGDIGSAGLESYYNQILTGMAGRKITIQNAENGEIAASQPENDINKPAEGQSLKLTIDGAVQYYLDTALSTAVKQLDASYGYGIVMDVKTGAILAMSSQPDFNCNEPYEIADPLKKEELEKITDKKEKVRTLKKDQYLQWRNRTISDTYEPGSVFKCFTAAAGLEEGVVTPDEMFTCTGSYQVEDRTYHCVNVQGHGTEDFTKALMNSCNPIFIEVAQRMGAKTFSRYFDAFGFSETTGVDLPAEAVPKAGITYYTSDNMHAVQLASCAFGQSFQVSPIQIITGVNAIANGGRLVKPYVVGRYLDEFGNTVKINQPEVKRQVISGKTAATMANMLEEVVTNGTGKNAYVPGYRVAGKTGTSEKLSKEDKCFIGSFCGFAPADDPEISVLIVIDEPKGGLFHGGTIASPVAGEVIYNTLRYKNIEPVYTEEEAKTMDTHVPGVTGMNKNEAVSILDAKGYKAEVSGNGNSVIAQFPGEGKLVPVNGIVMLYTEKPVKPVYVKVPTLTGLTPEDARARGKESGLNVEVVGYSKKGSEFSYRQSVAEGTKVSKGTVITVSYLAKDKEMEIEDKGIVD